MNRAEHAQRIAGWIGRTGTCELPASSDAPAARDERLGALTTRCFPAFVDNVSNASCVICLRHDALDDARVPGAVPPPAHDDIHPAAERAFITASNIVVDLRGGSPRRYPTPLCAIRSAQRSISIA